MVQHISFPSINQFRNVVKLVRDNAEHSGKPIPTLTFYGTTKLHGTNAAVSISHDNFWCQSRTNVITFEKDNAGFATYVRKNQKFYETFMSSVKTVFGLEKFKSTSILSVYGEWCGGSIQKGVALNGLDKMFVVFNIRCFNTETEKSYWFSNEEIKNVFDLISLDRELTKSNQLYLITDFPTWFIDIDFNNPEKIQNQLIDMTIKVEDECPVGKHFGISGVGEGIVFRASNIPEWLSENVEGLVFKSKGEKHSASKVKVISSVNVEKIDSIKNLVDSFVTENRCEQAIDVALKQQNLSITIENTGSFLKWLSADIIKEESDTIIENGFELKDVMGPINRAAKNWFMSYLDKRSFK